MALAIIDGNQQRAFRSYGETLNFGCGGDSPAADLVICIVSSPSCNEWDASEAGEIVGIVDPKLNDPAMAIYLPVQCVCTDHSGNVVFRPLRWQESVKS